MVALMGLGEMIIAQNEPLVLATEIEEGSTYVCCREKDGSGWTVRIPAEQFDEFRLAEAVHRPLGARQRRSAPPSTASSLSPYGYRAKKS